MYMYIFPLLLETIFDVTNAFIPSQNYIQPFKETRRLMRPSVKMGLTPLQ